MKNNILSKDNKIIYNGNEIDFFTLDTSFVTNEGQTLNGDLLFVTSLFGINIKHDTPDDGVWVMEQEDDDFQNIENFCKGIEYIDQNASHFVKEKCFAILVEITMGNKSNLKLSNIDVSKRIAFFCEVGVWENMSVRNPHLFDKDFEKYLSNVCWNYRLAE